MRINACRIFLSLLVPFVCGFGRSELRDVFTGPAVKAAIEAAKGVAPGSMELTAFSAFDTGDLIGIEGRSYIVKLPKSAPENPRYYLGYQWYVDGDPKGEVQYPPPRWKDWYVELTRCWLIDIAIQRNYFSESPDLEALAWIRVKSLDRSHGWGRNGPIKLKPPAEYKNDPDHHFAFWLSNHSEVRVGEDIPIGVWHVWTQSIRTVEPLQVAASAPVACVFFVRFQKEHPNDKKQ